MPFNRATFEAKVDRSGDHRLWLGSKTARGAGQIRIDGKLRTTIQVAWELEHGEVPTDRRVQYPRSAQQGTLGFVSDTERTPTGPSEPTLAEMIALAKPMGDLSRFVIDDLTEEDEDEFFSILADL